MAQQINDNFQILAGLPLDDRTRKPTIAERDAIVSGRRFQGLQCFVDQTQTLYQLQGGILNSNWVGIAGVDISGGLESIIDGFYVLLSGKETPLDWEVGDKFRGWIGGRYLVGSIVSLPVSLPSDIDNPAKVTLAIDSDSYSIGVVDSQPYVGVSQTYTLPISGAIATKGYINDAIQHKEKEGFESRLNTFTQTGDVVTFKKTIVAGNRIDIDFYF